MKETPSIIAPLELTEFLSSSTTATFVEKLKSKPLPADQADRGNAHEIRDRIRELLRIHRFSVMCWLLENGAQVPSFLLDDNLHHIVGHQHPDNVVDR